MVNGGRGVSWSQLVGVAVVVGGVAWVGMRFYLDAGNLIPPTSWVSVVLLVIMAVLVFSAGLPVRRFLRGEATRTLSPIRAARTLVLAQAAGLTGAGVLGWYAAQLVHALIDLDLASNRRSLWPLAAVCAAALLLAVAGMLTQRMCRIPHRRDRDHDRDYDRDRNRDRDRDGKHDRDRKHDRDGKHDRDDDRS